MGHLQRQQEGKLEMNLQEKQLLQAQLVFAHHAAAAARAAAARLDSPLFPKADGQTYPAAQPASDSQLLRHPADQGEEESDEEEQEAGDPEERNDMEEDEEHEEEETAKRARLQQVAAFPFPPYPTSQFSAAKQMAEPSSVKQEHEEEEVCSPAGQVFTSPGDFADWGYDEQLKQVGFPPLHAPFPSVFPFYPLGHVATSPSHSSHVCRGQL